VVLQIFNDSLKQEHWYFFSVTGLNITQKLIVSLTQGDFDMQLLNYFPVLNVDNAVCDIRNIMDYFYFVIFQLFNAKWVAEKPYIMEFMQFFDSVYTGDFMPNHGTYI
jgi:hypothetical protein